MSFITDKQTLDDLNLLGKYRPDSVIGLFNRVATRGGARLLEEMFREPLSDADAINARTDVFGWFQRRQLRFPFAEGMLEEVENYLGGTTGKTRLAALSGLVFKKLQATLVRDEQYRRVHEGLIITGKMLTALRDLVVLLDDREGPFQRRVEQLKKLFSDERLPSEWPTGAALSFGRVTKYDHLLKVGLSDEMEEVLKVIYEIDVYIAVSNVAREKSFSYASALPAGENVFQTKGLRHPGLGDKAVANPLQLDDEKNMLFLTGANMAGKSTFMKAFGIAVYLGHMGFPVAASKMVFSVREGLYSSINVSDDLAQGYSHFYAEVLRVKKVSEEVGSGKNLVVIFDELFKGTNVKDAYDATLAVTVALARYSNCIFIISTHIVEVGEALLSKGIKISCGYLPTVMEGNKPRYTYTIQEGISTDKHGMMIIRNEGILELLKN